MGFTLADGMDADFKRTAVVKAAVMSGVKSAIFGLPAIPIVIWAMKTKPNFVKNTNPTLRTALALSPAFILFSFYSERTLVRANRNPNAYGIFAGNAPKNIVKAESFASLKWYHRTANYLYEPLIAYSEPISDGSGNISAFCGLHPRYAGKKPALVFVTDQMAKAGGVFKESLPVPEVVPEVVPDEA